MWTVKWHGDKNYSIHHLNAVKVGRGIDDDDDDDPLSNPEDSMTNVYPPVGIIFED